MLVEDLGDRDKVGPLLDADLPDYPANNIFAKEEHSILLAPRTPSLQAIAAVDAAIAAVHPPMIRPRLSKCQFTHLYEAFAGTCGAYLCRSLPWWAGFATVATTSSRAHARLLCAMKEREGRRAVVLEMDAPEKEPYAVPAWLMALKGDALRPEIPVLTVMLNAEGPLVPVKKDGSFPAGELHRQGPCAFGMARMYGLQGQKFHEFDAEGDPSFSWWLAVLTEVRFCWWHRECHVKRSAIKSGEVRVRIDNSLWRGASAIPSEPAEALGEID